MYRVFLIKTENINNHGEQWWVKNGVPKCSTIHYYCAFINESVTLRNHSWASKYVELCNILCSSQKDCFVYLDYKIVPFVYFLS